MNAQKQPLTGPVAHGMGLESPFPDLFLCSSPYRFLSAQIGQLLQRGCKTCIGLQGAVYFQISLVHPTLEEYTARCPSNINAIRNTGPVHVIFIKIKVDLYSQT